MSIIPEQKRNRISVLFWLGIILVLISVLLVFQSKPERENTQVKVPFDQRLLACNDLPDAQPSESFGTCLEAAEAGWREAQKKIAWAYAQKGEFQDLEKSYQWVSLLAKYDRNAELIRYVMLMVFGDTPEDKRFGEKGIRRLANINYPAASAYLGIIYKLGQNSLSKTSDATWLLQRAHEQDPSVFNAYQLAIIYANGFGVEQDYSKARDVLLEYSKVDFPMSANNVAWFLATLESNPMSDPETAIALAESVTNEESYQDNHVYIDTLAATYAANEEFDKAVEVQKDALSLLQAAQSQFSEENFSRLTKEYEERLALYSQNKKAVTETLDREYEQFFAGVKVFVERRLLNSLNVTVKAPEVEQTDSP